MERVIRGEIKVRGKFPGMSELSRIWPGVMERVPYERN
jgi:hypothetical protein